LDLEQAAGSGNTAAVTRFLGGSPAEVPERYRSASPIHLLPVGVPQVIVHGTSDETIPAVWSQNYQKAAQAAGDEACYEPVTGADHLQMVAGTGPTWDVIARHLDRWSG
jgi:hypothetical protein